MNSSISLNTIPKVSVIVPVYNTELYVERAIISLMEQTLNDVQFIIIDDGSKDHSLNIIKQVIARYPERQGQVTLISRENFGVAATRAQGMSLATGDYVIHLDSDDWAEINWLEEMYNKAIQENADIVVCDYLTIYEEKFDYIHMHAESSGFACLKQLLSNKIHGYTWNKLIGRKVLNKIDTPFIDGINYLEDFIYILKCFSFADKISHHSKCLYNYNQQNINSITKGMNISKKINILNAVSTIGDFLHEKHHLLTKDLMYFKIKQKTFLIYSEWENVNKETWLLFPEATHYVLRANIPLHFKVPIIIANLKCYHLASYIMKNTIKLKLLISPLIKPSICLFHRLKP